MWTETFAVSWISPQHLSLPPMTTLSPISHPERLASGLKRDSAIIQSMIGYWHKCHVLNCIGCGMPGAPGDSCGAVVIGSPLNDLLRCGMSLKCALTSQLHIFFNVMKDLFMFWPPNFTDDSCVWQISQDCTLKVYGDKDTGRQVRACVYEISAADARSLFLCAIRTLINDSLQVKSFCELVELHMF